MSVCSVVSGIWVGGDLPVGDPQPMEGNKGHQRPLLPSLGHLGRVKRTEEEQRRRGNGGITIFGYPSLA